MTIPLGIVLCFASLLVKEDLVRSPIGESRPYFMRDLRDYPSAYFWGGDIRLSLLHLGIVQVNLVLLSLHHRYRLC